MDEYSYRAAHVADRFTVIRWPMGNQQAWSIVEGVHTVAYAGENGIEAGKPYKLNDAGEFVPAS